jgi:hypothetical protein
MELAELMDELAEPFDAERIAWKPQAVSGNRALAIGYADARTYQDRLNEAVRAEWSDDYEVLDDGAVVLCRLTICGVTRSDIGEAPKNDQNTATSALVQAFKRACVKFGVGRYLYDLPKKWVDYDPRRKCFTRKARRELRDSLVVLSHAGSEVPSKRGETRETAEPQDKNLETENRDQRPIQDSEMTAAQSVSITTAERDRERGLDDPGSERGADNGSDEATPTDFWSLYNKHKNRVSREEAQEWAATRNWEHALAELRARVA